MDGNRLVIQALSRLACRGFAASIIPVEEVSEPDERLTAYPDPADARFFEPAVAGRADCVVTEDEDIHEVRESRGVKAVNAEKRMVILFAG